MISVEDIYAGFLIRKQEENREKYKGLESYFSASSAGSCFKKQLYRKTDIHEPPMDDRVMRLLRLGTVVHSDVESALKMYMEDPDSSYQSNDIQVFVEHRVTVPELNIIGHLDIGLVKKESNAIKVLDLKTCASYKWRMKFGRKPDPKGNPGYNMQLATYLYGFSKDQEITDNLEMSLLWYNKDTSAMREEYVDNKWISAAIEYWEELNDYLDDLEDLDSIEAINNIEPGTYGVPMENWECRYCNFKDIYCKGV